MIYEVNEIFYSIKGEGVYTGEAMSFIRLSGCNLNCKWCDTNYEKNFLMNESEIFSKIKINPSRRVVITGGEPCLQELDELIKLLHIEGFKIHLETNGTLSIPPGFDWIAVSPKSFRSIALGSLMKANEIKIVCGSNGWKELASLADGSLMFNPRANLWLIPLAEEIGVGRNKTIQKNIDLAVSFCLSRPGWKLCTQIHKFCNFK